MNTLIKNSAHMYAFKYVRTCTHAQVNLVAQQIYGNTNARLSIKE